MRFLVFSGLCISVLCICIFTFLAVYMNRKSIKTLDEVAQMYMSSMSEQISLHFETTIGLRLDQVEALVEMIPEGNAQEAEKTRNQLTWSAQARNFE